MMNTRDVVEKHTENKIMSFEPLDVNIYQIPLSRNR